MPTASKASKTSFTGMLAVAMATAAIRKRKSAKMTNCILRSQISSRQAVFGLAIGRSCLRAGDTSPFFGPDAGFVFRCVVKSPGNGGSSLISGAGAGLAFGSGSSLSAGAWSVAWELKHNRKREKGEKGRLTVRLGKKGGEPI